jgi:hypothetical protein
MKYSCDVIRDLLPLYHDDVCSKQSRDIVEEHLKECESCNQTLKVLKKEISVTNTSREDAARAWKTMVRNLWFRRIAAIAVLAALIVAAAFVGKEIYVWDQERTIWLEADDTEYGAYRLPDGRIYVQFTSKDHRISVMAEEPSSEANDRNYILRIGYSKADQKFEKENPEVFFVVSDDYNNVILNSAGKDAGTVICGIKDELPSASEEMQQRVAEYDKMMESRGQG